MNVTMDLLHIVEQAHSLARILDAATRVIAERLRVDGCAPLAIDAALDEFETRLRLVPDAYVRDSFPTRVEQVRIYSKACELFSGGPIYFRILDLGGDKFVAGGSIATARSAFHGEDLHQLTFGRGT
jgi:phosphoenolpyruvate-protein kinase (PTS system EI component)